MLRTQIILTDDVVVATEPTGIRDVVVATEPTIRGKLLATETGTAVMNDGGLHTSVQMG